MKKLIFWVGLLAVSTVIEAANIAMFGDLETWSPLAIVVAIAEVLLLMPAVFTIYKRLTGETLW